MRKGFICAVTLASAVAAFAQTRPRDPFIFRTAINFDNSTNSSARPGNQKNRLVALLLSSGFTALYSTETGQGCGLYQVRTGTAQDGNSTYGHLAYGSVLIFNGGSVLHRNTTAQMWEVLNNGTATTSQTVYRGFTYTNAAQTTAALRYDIIAGGATIKISEEPEYVSGGNGGLRRTITVSGLGTGQSVRTRLTGTTATGESWAAGSGGTISGSNPQYFNIAANGTAVVTGSW
jgi:hypothetical protein